MGPVCKEDPKTEENSFHFFHSLTKGSKQSAISLFYISSSQNPSAFYWEGGAKKKKKIKKSLSYSLLSYSVPGEERESKSKKQISEPRGRRLKRGRDRRNGFNLRTKRNSCTGHEKQQKNHHPCDCTFAPSEQHPFCLQISPSGGGCEEGWRGFCLRVLE